MGDGGRIEMGLAADGIAEERPGDRDAGTGRSTGTAGAGTGAGVEERTGDVGSGGGKMRR